MAVAVTGCPACAKMCDNNLVVLVPSLRVHTVSGPYRQP